MLFIAFVALGAFVSSRPPTALDVAAHALKGQLTPLALAFTDLGTWYALVPIGIVAVTVAAIAHRRVALVAVWLTSQLLSQVAVILCKPLFHRVRPAGSLGYHLADFSYPSGHTVTAIVFYATAAALVSKSDAPPSLRLALCTLAIVCTAGIPWARMALGAHFATDVLGGVLFGSAWLCALAAFVPSTLWRGA